MNIQTFLQLLYGDVHKHFFSLWTEGNSTFYNLAIPDQLNNIAKDAINTGQHADVYYNICLQPKDYGFKSRGLATTAIVMPGVWADLDVKPSDPDKGRKFFTSREEALALITEEFPYKPSVVINSGGGLHAYWLFKQPFMLTNDDDTLSLELNEKARLMARRWAKGYLDPFFQKKQYAIDSTYDLVRMYRLPDTFNHKNPTPRPVTVAYESGIFYDVAGMLSLTDEVASQVDNVTRLHQINDKIIERQVGLFKISYAASLPKKVEELLSNNQGFKSVWDGNVVYSDHSPSAHEMGVANFLATIGLEAQEIVDSLIVHRKKFTGEGPKHTNYYMRTLEAAFNQRRRVMEPPRNQIDNLARKLEPEPEHQEEEEAHHDNNYKSSMNRLSRNFRCDVLSIIKYESERSIYVLNARGYKPLTLGDAKDLHSARTIKEKLYEYGIVIPLMKNAEWDSVLEDIQNVIKVEYNSETTDRGETRNWVRNYLTNRVHDEDMSGQDWKEHLRLGEPFYYAGETEGLIRQDYYYFNLWGFLQYIRDSFEKVSPKEMGTRLKMARIVPAKLQYRNGQQVITKQYWQVAGTLVRGEEDDDDDDD